MYGGYVWHLCGFCDPHILKDVLKLVRSPLLAMTSSISIYWILWMMCCSNTGVSLKSSYLWIEWIRFLSNSINFLDCPDYINPWMTMNWIKMSLFILLNIILSVTSDVLCENSGKTHFRISHFQFLFSKLSDRFEGRLSFEKLQNFNFQA